MLLYLTSLTLYYIHEELNDTRFLQLFELFVTSLGFCLSGVLGACVSDVLQLHIIIFMRWANDTKNLHF